MFFENIVAKIANFLTNHLDIINFPLFLSKSRRLFSLSSSDLCGL